MFNFKKKTVKTKNLGDKLKEIRQEAGVSLSELARAIRVKKDYLELLEAGEFNKLPADVYVQGFLRGYAKYLDIDSEDVMKLYERENGIYKKLSDAKDLENEKLERSSRNLFSMPVLFFNPKWFFGLLFLGFFALVGIYFYGQVDKFSKEPFLLVKNPTGDFSSKNEQLEVEGEVDKDSKLTINGQPILIDEDGEFKQNLTLKPGLNELNFNVINRFGNKLNKKMNIHGDFTPSQEGLMTNLIGGAFPREKVLGAADENLTINNNEEKISLTIKIKSEPTWISIEADGEKIFSEIINPNEEKTFSAKEVFFITSTWANRTLIKFGGNENFIPLDKKDGLVRDIAFTKNDLEKSNEINQKTNESNNEEILALKNTSETSTVEKSNTKKTKKKNKK